MSDGIGAMGAVFSLVGFLFAVLGVVMAVTLLRRAVGRGRALSHGLTAEARCLEAYVTRSSDGSSRRRVILGFTTVDGQQIRIEETPRGPIVAGDFVQVRYLPERPQQAVQVGGSVAGTAVGTVFGLVFCSCFVAVGLAVGLSGLGVGLFAFGPFANG
ncbi:DUF3592 domain-containing protein [Streptacidiphilus sp. PB12-B1b]|uniref:DUF3592 domain-containing protein n=1 Tax=Streptacidiphilus sp. PB12-B1b TaxID=2705012 RepID=UPI0015F8B4AE|nr:DUF3592 domain-containing protein [Streptacidiphilus sp. PB12-B1b]QMU77532.1 DUF3592 domain-containing protein [Streptacidiphilus sp. PB12-B1b]